MATASASAASATTAPAARQQEADHHLHLLLGGVAGADHGALDLLGGVFVTGEPGVRCGQQHHAAGMAQLER